MLEIKMQIVDYVEKEQLQRIENEYNFHIDSAPNESTEEEVENYFTLFGDVFSCELKSGDKHKYGYLSFRSE